MTREKAIVIIGNLPIDGKDKCYSIAEYQEAKTMAIEALNFDIDQYCKEHFVVMVDEDLWDKAEKALEQEPILDKIRAEIVEMWQHEPCAIESGCLDEVLEVIDKYKAESEE